MFFFKNKDRNTFSKLCLLLFKDHTLETEVHNRDKKLEILEKQLSELQREISAKNKHVKELEIEVIILYLKNIINVFMCSMFCLTYKMKMTHIAISISVLHTDFANY